jgi:surface carbohydrate biosynthesis protein (TIGR04326 family)
MERIPQMVNRFPAVLLPLQKFLAVTSDLSKCLLVRVKVSILVIFDDSCAQDYIGEIPLDSQPIVLLPLTGNWKLIREVKLKFESRWGTNVSVLDTAHLVTDEAKVLRGRLGDWSGRLEKIEVKGKTLKTWLNTPDKNASAFWFGPISEKNPLKTDLFLRIIQANIIFKHMSLDQYSACLLGISNSYLRESVIQMGAQRGLKVQILSSLIKTRGVLDKIQRWCEGRGLWGQVVLGLLIWARFVFWRVQAGSPKYGDLLNKELDNSLMVVTYFPYVDWKLARAGIFHNIYTGPLQQKFKDHKLKVIWLLLYVTIDGKSYKDALKLKKSLVSHEEKLFFLEEFVSFGTFVSILWNWVQQIKVSVWLNQNLSDDSLCDGLCDITVAPIVRQLWFETTCGPDAVKNLVYFESFKNIFGSLKRVSQCMYYCEMQGWEAALNAAAREVNPSLRRIGHQHSAFSVNFFPFLRSAEEVKQNGKKTDFPLPDVLACNGNSDYRILAKVGYTSLRLVEAVRQLHIPQLCLTVPRHKDKANILLVAGSIEYEETKAMLSLVSSAFPIATDFEIWLKGHPSLALEGILKELGIDNKKTKYHIKVGRIEEFLAEAKAVIVPASTVAVEALAFGCEVIVPFFSGSLPLSPLLGYEEYYYSVYEPDDLQKVMHTVLNSPPQMNVEAKQEFVKDYWCLDPSLSRWMGLLKEKRKCDECHVGD